MKNKILITFLLFSSLSAFSQGPEFDFVKDLGGRFGREIVVDNNGNIYCSGVFNLRYDFDPGPDSFFMEAKGGYDAYITKLSAKGDFIWAKQIGGLYDESLNGLKIDAKGDIFLVGIFEENLVLEANQSTIQLSSNGREDVFFGKMDATGNFIWAKSFGGEDSEEIGAFLIDQQSNIYISGRFTDTIDVDPSAKTNYLFATNYKSVYNLKFNSMGDLLWANQWSVKKAKQFIYTNALALDALENVYIAGAFNDTVDFDPSTNTLNSISMNYDAYICKFDALGNFISVKHFINASVEQLLFDDKGNLIVTGDFNNTANFDPTDSQFSLSSNGKTDIFVCKLSESGEFLWAKSFGGWRPESVNSTTIDSKGDIYLVGSFEDTVDFNPGLGIHSVSSIGSIDMYISKISQNGDFLWVFTAGDMFIDEATSIKLDKSGSIYVTGAIRGKCDFDPSTDTFFMNSYFYYRAFALKWNQPGFNSVVNRFIEPVKIYPNPNQGVLNIELNKVKKNVMLTLKNSMGQILMQQNYEQVKDIALNLDQEAGIYFLEIKTDENVYQVLNVVKQ